MSLYAYIVCSNFVNVHCIALCVCVCVCVHASSAAPVFMVLPCVCVCVHASSAVPVFMVLPRAYKRREGMQLPYYEQSSNVGG